jgi:hypothetical protein
MPKSIIIPMEVVADHFRFPIEQAAKLLGVCVSVLKKACRKQGRS